MISTAQLQSLDFWYDIDSGFYEYKDINVEIIDNSCTLEMIIKLQDFQLYGIRDVRDLTKLIDLVYGS
jgi:hypothetical protein